MREAEIKYDNQVIGQVFNHLPDVEVAATPQVSGVALALAKTTSPTRNGYTGFRDWKGLRMSIRTHIVDYEIEPTTNIHLESYRIPADLKKHITSITHALKEACSSLPAQETTEIHIFPTFSEFVKEKMLGVTGYAPYQNVFHIYLHPDGARFGNL